MTPNQPSEGAREPDEANPQALAGVRDRLLERLPSDRAQLAIRLMDAAYRRAPEEQLRQLDPTACAAKFSGALEFMDSRAPDALALRIFNPTLEADGWAPGGTVVQVTVEDRPFLLSTISEELERHGLEITEVVHPVLGVERGADGRLAALLPGRSAGRRDALIHIELAARLAPERIEALVADLERVLGDAIAATRDFGAMRARVEAVIDEVRSHLGGHIPEDEGEEVVALLEWILDDHFVLLGSREYDVFESEGRQVLQTSPGSGLGILADEARSSVGAPKPVDELPASVRIRVERHALLLVSRTNRTSTVHRQERMIYIGVRKFGPSGEMAGEHRFLGLLAHKAQAQAAGSIPVLRKKLAYILQTEDVVEHSYDERVLRTLFESLPKHELFEADPESLRRLLVELVQNEERREVGVHSRIHSDGRGVSVLVALPRERVTAALRAQIESLLMRRLDGVGVHGQMSANDSGVALLHYVVHTVEDRTGDIDREDLAHRIRALARTWEDELRTELAHRHGPTEGTRLAGTFLRRLPPGYTDQTSVETAALDIAEIDRLLAGETDARMVLRDGTDEQGLRRFVAFKRGAGVELSEFMPVLESLGLRVVEEIPYRLEGGPSDAEINIHDFGVRLTDGDGADVDWDSGRLSEAAMAAWAGNTAADSLNRLVMRASMSWQDVDVLRAYRRYLRQLGTSFTERYQDDSMVAYPQLSRSLLDLFAARFDPAAAGDESRVETARRQVLEHLDALERLDDDRILRGLLAVIDATVRTNRYARNSEALALKFDSSRLPDPPKPVPHAEVFVHGTQTEGIHLRGGPIARGGIRWSDRREDYRTEVLGLMKSQILKNALIVPTGAKGGFVIKSSPSGAVAVRQEVRRQYATYVRALLDVTDNIVAGEVVPPAGVRRADGDDPYLVVAADRGTADLSDLANEISAEYNFWLADAFASGGSRGYDHRAMGITARGAWVAVQQHFRELNVDVQTEPISVVG
ncbi:MAG TPA: NAD-glutamate dehydrogenase domain-containing protein, partial [Egibacteraceae bacterium]|nr:NAD-glutamate dehydrogenase domain-containing protein [Egibacteraceae bacterium]